MVQAEEDEEGGEAPSLGKKGKRKKHNQKPLWRLQAEERRASRLEEEERREKELLQLRKRREQQRRRRIRKKEASASGGRKRRSGGKGNEEERELEELDEQDEDYELLLLLLSSQRHRTTTTPVAAADLLPRGLPPNSFHPLNPGVDFAAAYRWGLRGTFEEFTPLGKFDQLLHFVNGWLRPRGRWLRRCAAFVARGGRAYFRPF